MRYGIVADSGCDLRYIDGAEAYSIAFHRVPLTLRVGEKEFVDNLSLDVKTYMQEMSEYKGKSGSAAPSPGEWYNAYNQAEEVFALTITGTLSGSYQSAVTARDMLLEEHPDKKICVIDSKSAGPELTLLVKKLTEYMEQNLPFEEMVKKITEYQKRTHLLFVLESLDNLVKNGRVSKIAGNMAGLLGIRILGCASEAGNLEIIQKCRGKVSVYEKMIEEMVKKGYQGSKVIISHCFNEEKAEYIKELLHKSFPTCKVEIMPTSGLCSFYAEQSGILLAFES